MFYLEGRQNVSLTCFIELQIEDISRPGSINSVLNELRDIIDHIWYELLICYLHPTRSVPGVRCMYNPYTTHVQCAHGTYLKPCLVQGSWAQHHVIKGEGRVGIWGWIHDYPWLLWTWLPMEVSPAFLPPPGYDSTACCCLEHEHVTYKAHTRHTPGMERVGCR